MENIIQTCKLSKRYGNTHAVESLSINVPKGSIYAFLGPNGAGKTTTIKLLMNIIEPTEGASEVLGVNSRRLSTGEFQKIGYVAEDQKLPNWMTVNSFVEYCKAMYPTWDDDFSKRLMKQFELPGDRKLKHLSRGMKMKAALLSSIAYRPRLLILDEPFSGLDPLVRDEFIRGVLELTEQEQWTVFVSSHDIDEVGRLADWVGIINKGTLRHEEATSSLLARYKQIETVVPDLERIPGNLPDHWLLPEHASNTFKFIDSDYQQGTSETAVKSTFPSCRNTEVRSLSLREVFLVLARTYRLDSEGANK